MNSPFAARGSREEGFTQPRAHLLDDPCNWFFRTYLRSRIQGIVCSLSLPIPDPGSVPKITKFPRGWKFRSPLTCRNSTCLGYSCLPCVRVGIPLTHDTAPSSHTRRQTHTSLVFVLLPISLFLTFSFAPPSIPKKRGSVDGAQVEARRCPAGAPRKEWLL